MSTHGNLNLRRALSPPTCYSILHGKGLPTICLASISHCSPRPETAIPLGVLTQGPSWSWKWASGHLDSKFLETFALNHPLNGTALDNGQIHNGLKKKMHMF